MTQEGVVYGEQQAQEELLRFCRRFAGFFCYGAGSYGQAVVKFLRERDIVLRGVIVSQSGDSPCTLEGVPVDAVEDRQEDLRDTSYGIILSLDEAYQGEVKEVLQRAAIPLTDRVYSVTSVQMFYLQDGQFAQQSGQILRAAILHHKPVDESSAEVYEERFCQLHREFQRIEVRFMSLENIGSLSEWICHCNWADASKERQVFRLFFPFPFGRDLWDPRERGTWDWLYRSPNQFVTDKLKCRGMEVIQPKTLGFWQYCLRTHGDVFDIKNGEGIASMMRGLNAACEKGGLHSRERYMALTPEEEAQGEAFLKKIGVKRWVCFAARDKAYLRDVLGAKGAGVEISDIYRNMDVNTMELAAAYFAARGISTFRMGAKVEGRLQSGSLIIDYVNRHRTELLDAFLFSHCLFFLSNPSGIASMAALFNRPLVQINSNVFSTRIDSNLVVDDRQDLMIMQKYWDPVQGRCLTFREMLQTELYGDGRPYSPYAPENTYVTYHRHGIVPIRNTPEEILAVAREMMERLEGTIEYTAEDLALQERFRDLRQAYTGRGNYFFNFRMGRDFLRENQWMLD